MRALYRQDGQGRRYGPPWPVFACALILFGLSSAGCGRQGTAQPSPEPTATLVAVRPTPMATLAPKLADQDPLPPFVSLEATGAGEEMASSQRPAYLSAELTGRDLSNVSLIGGALLEDGRGRVFIHHPVDPNPDDEQWPGSWPDGVHDLVSTWDFSGDFLWDGQNGDFAVLWATDPNSETRTTHGRFRKAGEDVYRDGLLIVNILTGRAEDVIDTSTGETWPFQAGDEFQLTELMIDENGALSSQPGLSLSFQAGGHLAHTLRPGPSGPYFLSISAESAGGDSDMLFTRFQVNNDALAAGYKAYLEPLGGFQVPYPESWPEPLDQGGSLLFSNAEGDTQMSISSHPDMSDQPLADLKRRALEAYGDVTVLYEDQMEIGQAGGLRTVYGYQAPAGPRTGILLAFALEGQAFVVDIDGPAEEESALQELAAAVAGGWSARPIVATSQGGWTTFDVDGLPVKAPVNHRHVEMSNGWQRFAGDNDLTFVAFRSEPAAEQGLFTGIERWLGVARRDVRDFASSESYTLDREGRSWARIDFEYALEDVQQVAGAIMLARFGDRFLILWAEAPAAEFAQYDGQTLQTIVDDLSQIP